MAGASRYTALLDANVLFPKLQCDALLSLAHAGLYAAKWTADIEREWLQARNAKFPHSAAQNQRKAEAMAEAIPDCMVQGYDAFVACLELPDPDDRHVLAAAIVGHADAIVTNNVADFPLSVLQRHGIDRQTPDQFIVNQLTLHPPAALDALRKMRERWRNPAYTPQALVGLFELRGRPLTAVRLQEYVGIL